MLSNAEACVQSPAEVSVDSLFALLIAQGDGDYIGESISQLEHLLQAAYSAKQANADNATILAALLHDVGQFLPNGPTNQLLYNGVNVGRVGHEKLGADWLLSQGYPAKVAELVGSHVMAKRALCALSDEYYEALSDASKASLKLQGGAFTPSELAEFKLDPLADQKIALRRWDDAAKVVDLVTPDLASYREMAIDILQNGIVA